MRMLVGSVIIVYPMVFPAGELQSDVCFLGTSIPVVDFLSVFSDTLSIATTMCSSRTIGKGVVLMTVTLLVVGVCGVRIPPKTH